MSKKKAHIILLLGDLFCFWLLWIGYHEWQSILLEITNQADVIKVSSREGFYIFGIFLPPIHFLTIVEHFRPTWIHKYVRLMNQGAIITLIALFAAGFIGSSWIKSKVENAGYVYCRNASGVSALAKTLVYTKDMAICEALVESKRR